MEEKSTKTDSVDTASVAKDSAAVVDAPASAPRSAKKSRRQVFKGHAHIQCSYNNTIVTITDLSGNVLGWSSSGLLGFKGAKKSTPFAASQVVRDVSEKIKKYGTKEFDVFVRGVGGGRDGAIRAIAGSGFEIKSIKDMTPIAHNGCRAPSPRRI